MSQPTPGVIRPRVEVRTAGVAFPVSSHHQAAGRLDTSDLDLESGFAEDPLPSPVLRCLQYMHDIEHHTVCYLRDLLVTSAHRDPEITEFLTVWNYEEHWHGEAIGRVLAAHGRPAGPGRVGRLRDGLPLTERLRPIGFALGSAALPELPAVHLVWGAVNEWCTQAGYGQLARRAGHPLLGELLRRIMRQEGRHIAFYSSAGRSRLERSGAARRLTRVALERLWRPVGHGVVPAEETRFVVRYLFGDEAGAEAAARIDRNVARLPGLQGLTLVSRAVDRYGRAA
jgi:hypothetical protein